MQIYKYFMVVTYKMLIEVNQMDICLIPKTNQLEFISQFRPIAFCNAIYKILSRILVNRMKGLVNDIITPNQTGFVPQRSIHGNLVGAQELLYSMHQLKGKNSLFAIKVDLAKAFDRVSWKFVENMLLELRLPRKLRDILMQSITIVQMHVNWNGNKGGYFYTKKGLRQGNLISLYLFVLCMDKLSHLILDAVENKHWIGLKAGMPDCFSPHVHGCGQAIERKITSIMEVWNVFCAASGQQISKEKNRIMFSKKTPIC